MNVAPRGGGWAQEGALINYDCNAECLIHIVLINAGDVGRGDKRQQAGKLDHQAHGLSRKYPG